MKKNRQCLIGRYEAVKNEDRVEIYDTANVQHDVDGSERPMKVIHLDNGQSARQGCLQAIRWLRDHGRIDNTDYFRQAETFMGSDSIDRH